MLKSHLGVAIVLSCASTVALAQEWRPIDGTSSKFNTSVTRLSPSVMRVWEKYMLSPEHLEYLQRQGLAEKYRDYAYTLALRQIDCSRQTHGFVIITDYNARDLPTVPSVDFSDTEIEMLAAEPGTNAEALLASACEYAFKRTKKK